MNTLLFVNAILFGVVAYSFYFRDNRKKSITPNKWSWLIWIVTAVIEAMTFDAVSEDPMISTIFYVSAACTVVLTVCIWARSSWQMPDWTEILCILASIAAIVVWLRFGHTVLAHYIAVAAVPVSFIPTWKGAWKDFRKEDSIAWKLWTIGDLFVLFLVVSRLERKEELPLAIAELVCHGITWWIVSNRRSKSACHK